MQLLSANQIRDWDHFTLEQEPVASIDLMERAAGKCVEWLEQKPWKEKIFRIFCGKGNNGGDGLAIARLLHEKGYTLAVYILEFGKAGSEDFQMNLQRLHDLGFSDIHFLQSKDMFPEINQQDVVIDALFGTGLSKHLEGLSADLVATINHAAATVVAIDLPSGMFADQSSKSFPVIEADFTLTFQVPKLAFLMQENAHLIGKVITLDIGLHPNFLPNVMSDKFVTDPGFVEKIYRPRNRFAHKGSFGHALIMAGSFGKMGAAVLATRACVKSGAGLTTAFIPRSGYEIMQIAVPEAMVICDDVNDQRFDNVIHSLPESIEKYTAVGIGPGLGTGEASIQALSYVIRRYEKPLVIDADGLNCIALKKDLLQQLPAYSILTPHPKEFERLFGSPENDFERLKRAAELSREHQLIIVLKSHHTAVAVPEGNVYFNTTGNAGMAKGGSGDVLTGIITALLAQGYTPGGAAILGVYVHGLSADLAVKTIAEESLTARDIIHHLPEAFKSLVV